MEVENHNTWFYLRTVNFVVAVFVILSLVISSFISQLPTPGFFQTHLRRSVPAVDFGQMRLKFCFLPNEIVSVGSFSFSFDWKIPMLQRDLLGDKI